MVSIEAFTQIKKIVTRKPSDPQTEPKPSWEQDPLLYTAKMLRERIIGELQSGIERTLISDEVSKKVNDVELSGKAAKNMGVVSLNPSTAHPVEATFRHQDLQDHLIRVTFPVLPNEDPTLDVLEPLDSKIPLPLAPALDVLTTLLGPTPKPDFSNLRFFGKKNK